MVLLVVGGLVAVLVSVWFPQGARNLFVVRFAIGDGKPVLT